jgi:hypothetical protein
MQTQALLSPPLSTPYLSPVPDQGHQRSRGGGGRSRCWSSPASWAPTVFSHGSDPSNMSAATVTFDGSPFSREKTPVGAPEPKMSLPHDNNGAWERGGLSRRGDEAWWGEGGGGQGEKTHVLYLRYLLSEKKFTRPLHLNPTHTSIGWLQLLIHPWSVAPLRIDSRWKKSAYLRGTPNQEDSPWMQNLLFVHSI